ncbi:MAG: helical backbone metal receptor [Pseudomonadota bacterium]
MNFEDAIGNRHPRAEESARIVSLVPSLTELVIDLELDEQLVGRTGFCIHPRTVVKKIAKVGGTKDVNFDALKALAPTHVLVNIDENTRETYESLQKFVPHVIVTHPETPQDNTALYALVGGIFNREAQARRLAGAFERALQRLKALPEVEPRKVLYLIWRDPWMTVTPETYIARMLKLINWETVPSSADARYPEIDLAEQASASDLILLSSEPYPFRDKHLDEVRALSNGVHTMIVDGEMLSWYGSRAIPGLQYLATLATDERGSLH